MANDKTQTLTVDIEQGPNLRALLWGLRISHLLHFAAGFAGGVAAKLLLG